MLSRKRFIGNDVCMIVFKQGDEPFSPALLTSQFTHVIVIVQPEGSAYRVCVCSRDCISGYRPFVR